MAKRIAAAVLTHPLIRGAGTRYGSVIGRDALTKILLDLAAGDGAQKKSFDPAARQALVRPLATRREPPRGRDWKGARTGAAT